MLKSGLHKRIPRPPRWADRFLEWYCHPDLLEEIQGDAYELYFRQAEEHPRIARLAFCWNVLRFLRWKNIRKKASIHSDTLLTLPMLKNILLVTIRQFLRQPGHTTLNIFGLSIGFCCAFVILLWVNHEFSYDRFHPDAGQIYKVISHVGADGAIQTFDAASAAIDISSVPEAEALVTVSDGTRWPHTLCFRPDQKTEECIYLNGVYATPSLFSVFELPVLQGDAKPLNNPLSMAISESMAQKLYGDEPAVGKVIKVDNWLDVTITSVFKDLPVNSTLNFSFAMPFAVQQRLWGINEDQMRANFFPTYIKSMSQVTPALLTEKINDVSVLPEELKNHKVSYEAYPLTDWRLHNKFENGRNNGGKITYVNLFILIGGLILLLAIINYVNLTTARATTRAKEIGIRKVNGAFRHSIVLQFLSESFVLVAVSFAVAVFLSHMAMPFFIRIIGEPLTTNWTGGSTPMVMLLLLLLVSIAAGLYPAFMMSSFQPVTILKKQMGANGSGKLRKGLLLVQLIVSLCILNFSGVMYYQLNFIDTKDLGFEHRNTLRIEPTINIFRSMDVFKNEVMKDPSVISVAASNLNPIGASGQNISVSWPGKLPDTRVTFQTIGCSYEFPETIGLKILEGRNFEAAPLDSLHTEVLITADAAKTMNLIEPVGAHLEINGKKCVIIGVVNDFHTESFHQARLPVILYRTNYIQTAAVYVRYQAGTSEQALAAVGAAYKKIEPAFTMKYWFQDEAFDNLYKTEKSVSVLIVIFTGISILIAFIGVVGLSTFNVIRKTKEIGIRRVLGASVPQVLRLLSGEFSKVLVIAFLFAIPISWYAATSWLSGYAYHTEVPWWLFSLTFGSIAATTVTIICLQGLRTITANPTTSLRSE